MNYEKFIADLAGPLLRYPQEMIVKKFAEDDEKIVIHIMVNSEDIGRIIGKKGRIINSIRTRAQACAAKYGKKMEISVDSF
ncbi:MAG: KH domain-containing protein [Bacilli bacterium]